MKLLIAIDKYNTLSGILEGRLGRKLEKENCINSLLFISINNEKGISEEKNPILDNILNKIIIETTQY
ncbi:hypothetical protein SAMN05421832_105108 [Psychrobacillus psychrodurans]|nr:hypothetical protein SAMN05421832_105108 [Psychrobacillus psychrodurans]